MSQMTEHAIQGANSERLHWLDNLRTFVIFLVVLYHIGGVYESAGLWASFWIVDDPTTLTWAGIMGILFDIMVMPLMFFVAGYLVPISFKGHSPSIFLMRKFKRLMVPWFIAVLTLIPLYKIIFLYSRDLPQETWTTYFHFVSPNGQNWLWFLPVLFLFNIIYVLVARSGLTTPRLSIGKWVLLASTLGFVYSILAGGSLGFRSWTHSALLDFENERLLLYFMTFFLGAQSFKSGLFSSSSPKKLLYNIANGLAWIPVTLHIFARLYPFFFPEGFEVTLLYRMIWWSSFDLSLVVLMYVMLGTFWRYFNRTGPLWGQLNRNSYGVYIIHVIIIGLFGTLLMNTSLPVGVKYPLLIVLTYVFSNLLVWLYKSTRKKVFA